MDLLDFIDSNLRNVYIEDSGLSYYVRKSMFFKGLIELAACSTLPEGYGKEDFAYWKFLKKYEHKIPFKAEQVLNPDLAALYRRRKWTEYQVGDIPQFFSPLAMEMFHDHKFMKMYLGESSGMRKWINLCEGILDDVRFSLEKSEFGSSNWSVMGTIDGKTVCIATFKRGKNNYTRGYRIGYYSVFDPHKGKGLGSAMVEFFEKETGFKAIPSQLFGAGGKLTKDGHRAAIARLKRTKPHWLPDNWEELITPPLLESVSDFNKAISEANKYATLEAEILDDNEIFIAYVEGSKGNGAKAIQTIIDFADRNNMKIVLTVLNNSQKLIDYWMRFGFNINGVESHEVHEFISTLSDDEDEVSMYRLPKPLT